MNLLNKTSLFALSLLLFTACKKEEFNTTGSVKVQFRNTSTCFGLYTENSFKTTGLPLLSYSSGVMRGQTDYKISMTASSVTFDGLLYGNYYVQDCSNGASLLVQVVPGETRNYAF